ncbi:MAG: flagellar protein FlaG [Treponema sp.]|nr:flagellar protein FlaG [Treponema sp.]
MNTISTSMVHMAMDGQALYKSATNNTKSTAKVQTVTTELPSGAQVAQSIEKNMADIKADSQQLQKMSEMVEGHKLQFNVNKELGTVIVKIVDPQTEQVLKEIPSEDMQRLKLRIRRAIGELKLK